MYLVQRHRQWWAMHDIPKDVRDIIGRGARYAEPLKTEDRKLAERRAIVLEVAWRSEIEAARKGTRDHIERDADFWRQTIRETPEEHRELVLDMLSNELQARIDGAMARAGYLDDKEPGAWEVPEVEEAMRFHAIATGKLVKLDEHLDEWLATLGNEQKSKDMKKSTILKFGEAFPYVQDVKRKEVQRWVNKQAEDGKAVATIRRSLSELRGYWTYLTAIEVVPDGDLPFDKLNLPKPNKRDAVMKERRHFEPADVVKLLNAAVERQDTQLADLIRLGMWTGARLEELCALRVEKVGEGFFSIEDAKTAAGWRKVPIHPKLAATMKRLVEDSADSFVLSGLTENKYGDRSNALGKRFGRLKKDEGFGETHVFHSIRHTVAHQFKNAGVQEAIAADILGHEHEKITFGTYASEQARLETLKPVLELLAYPGA